MFWNTSRPHILQLSEALGSAFSHLEEQEQTLSAYSHFLSFLIIQKILHCTRKQRSRLLWNYWIQRSPQYSKPSENNNTRFSLAKSTTRCIKFTKRLELWIDFSQLNDIFKPPWSERTHCMENGQSVFFSRLTRVWGARLRLFRYSYATLNRFWEKKTYCFAVYYYIDLSFEFWLEFLWNVCICS